MLTTVLEAYMETEETSKRTEYSSRSKSQPCHKVVMLDRINMGMNDIKSVLCLEERNKDIGAFTAAGTVNENYASILALLLRLRQACDHPLLVKEYHPGPVASASLKKAQQLPRELLTHLLNQLEVSSAICGICSDQPEDAVVTMCGHVFCYQCISGFLSGDDNHCPAASCKGTLDANSAFSGATLRKCVSGEPVEVASGVVKHFELGFQSSSKIEAVMDILSSICKDQCTEAVEGSNERSPSPDGSSMTLMENHTNSNSKASETKSSKLPPEIPVKAIVFSQWTSMLDLIETSLNHSLIQYRRLDGTMSLPSRDRAVKDFNSDPEVTVMLMSLKAGNLGLNMIAACHVILLDPWWNPTTEDQAIDRAHRIGQTRPVTVSRLTVSETVEDRILALQEKKKEMVSSAFGEDQALGAGRAARLTAEDLRYLFFG
ncbi:hypothetical protein Taro_009429 [Colocasia esculenta]|uniref:Helicase-like transcription factor CHR28 n=1 Tax=Colocasia esculenta TaxID=4460 RepID=A0A843U4U5_COLES|nr:hypothetical protein [Colocasia esculenta]